MDDDDLGEQAIGENITTTEEFSSLGFQNSDDVIANTLGISYNLAIGSRKI